jgi:hypothetical protein
MSKVLLFVHGGLLIAGYLLFLSAFLVRYPLWMGPLLAQTVRALAVFAALLGFGLMAVRKGRNESIALAVSTITAVVLLLIMW